MEPTIDEVKWRSEDDDAKEEDFIEVSEDDFYWDPNWDSNGSNSTIDAEQENLQIHETLTDQGMLQHFVNTQSIPFKTALLELLMKECYPIIGYGGSTSFGNSGGPSSSQPVDRNADADGKLPNAGNLNQRRRPRSTSGSEDEEGGKGEEPNRKKPKANPKLGNQAGLSRRFACLYYKHNSRRFCRASNPRRFSACDHEGWEDIGKLKYVNFHAM
jgi:hypothetical protein